ncbi:MAG: ComF family protein [Bacteroidaceae bacterium]|nr:ComF family protein [Bacteroidaceae bacterium]
MLTKRWISDLLDLIFPRHCIVCGEILSGEERDICLNCLVRMPLINDRIFAELERLFLGIVPIERTASYMCYRKRSSYNRLLHYIKYKGYPEVATRLAKSAAVELKEKGFFDGIEAIVPLPLSKKKYRKRGYNQCDYIAQGIAEVTNIPVINDCIVRVKANETQTHKSREERWKNVEGIFSLVETEKIRERHILLIDDVLTTGATLANCAKELQKCGCKVSIFTLAYATDSL